ncbi:MAG TPA: WYL domain-containing protein [Noviherbaspirillum sp.]|nr:WYL domain-containing protein [Noviherbaspirillum sp.]
MDRSERFHKIDQLLTARRIVPLSTLLKELEVSPATFKRDLQYMRDRLHAPIVFDRDANGYRFDTDPAAGAHYALPGLWFNDSELHALLAMQQLLDGIEPGLLGQHIKPLQAKLQGILCSLNDSPEEIARRVRIIALGRRKIELRGFQTIATATVRRKRLRIVHWNRASNTQTERIVSPQQIVYYRDNWYLDCWCHLRKDIRSFGIDAIESAELLAEPAKELAIKALRDLLSSGYGIFSGRTVQWAKLRIGPTRARWVSRTVWHSDQRASFDEGGHYLLEIPYTDDRELIQDILALMPDVEVLAPKALRVRIRAVLQDGLTKTVP